MAELDEPTLRRMYLDEGQSIRQIASALGISSARVRRALIDWRIPRRQRGPRQHMPIIADDVRTTVRARVAVFGVQRTARQLGLAPHVIHTILGTRPLPRGSKPCVDDQAVWAAYERQEILSGLSMTARVAALATQFGCSGRTIWRSLQRTRGRVALAPHVSNRNPRVPLDSHLVDRQVTRHTVVVVQERC
jgi:transposase-like protein